MPKLSLEQMADREARDNATVTRIADEQRKAGQTLTTAPRVELIDAASVRPQPIRWLWPGWLARGKLHVLAGAPGTGKTTLAMDLAARISASRPLPSGWKPKAGNVLIWSGEDSPEDTLVPRLLAAGADLQRIRFVGATVDNGQAIPFDPARDMPLLVQAIGVDDLALMIVDPLVSAVAGDSHKNAEVRRGLAPLVELAASKDAALLGITHYSKGTNGRDPLERVSGSLAFGALARVVLGTVRQLGEDDTPPRLILARAKSNIGPDGGGYVYAFEQNEVAGHPGLFASRIVWGEEVEGAARDLLTEAEPERDGDDGNDAETFLRDLLTMGSRPATEVFAEAKGAGFSQPQMKRAKKRAGVTTHKAGMGGGWVWSLSTREGSAKGTKGSGNPRLNPSTSSPPSAEPDFMPDDPDAEVIEL